MKTENTALSILRTIGAVLFSVLLVTVLVLIPLHSTAAGVTQPQKLATMVGDVVRDADLSVVFTNLPQQLQLGEYKLDTTVSQKLLQSQVAKDILGDCSEQIILAATSGRPEDALTEDKISAILSGRLDELTALVKQHIPQMADKSTGEIRQQLTDNLTVLSQAVLKELPAMVELQQLTGTPDESTPTESTPSSGDTPQEEDPSKENAAPSNENDLTAVRRVLSPTVTLILWGAVVLLAALVMLCRYKNLNGLVWLGADCLIAGCLLLIVCILLHSGATITMQAQEQVLQTLLGSAVQVMVNRVQTRAILLLVAGVVLMTGGIVYKVWRCRTAHGVASAPEESVPAVE